MMTLLTYHRALSVSTICLWRYEIKLRLAVLTLINGDMEVHRQIEQYPSLSGTTQAKARERSEALSPDGNETCS